MYRMYNTYRQFTFSDDISYVIQPYINPNRFSYGIYDYTWDICVIIVSAYID